MTDKVLTTNEEIALCEEILERLEVLKAGCGVPTLMSEYYDSAARWVKQARDHRIVTQYEAGKK